jgi:mono/diheme cytochrome c family protein/glucose/arabinose dehydrogenase
MKPPARSTTITLATLCAGLLTTHLPAAHAEEFPPKPPVKALSPQDELKTFQLPPGYRLELVLSEPDIKEPGVIAFDGDGRMFVAELRGYMQDIDGKNQLDKISRVSLHWSSKGDGVYDKHTVFIDNLILPRMLVALDKGRIIVGETNTNDLFIYSDTDGDGVSDKKEPFYVGGGRGGNLEHQPNGLVWAIDNTLYSTYNDYRLRWTPAGAVKEKVGGNGGQWGLCQDSFGKLLFMNAGGEQGPRSFQQPILYGGFNPGGQFAPGFEVVWPAIGLADVQGGHGRHRADGTLNHFTATCGSEFFRGDRLPAELHGDLFFGEPVGRLVRRAKVEVKEGFTTLSNPHQDAQSEFLRSTDPCFRPVNFNNAPDGTLYIADMYRGIIQEGNWVRPGSYLRKVVEQYGMQNVFGHGRIWRLVHDSVKPGPQPRMNAETPAQLVAHLGHPNGWWRDTAQKLLVLKQDKSVAPALTAMARTDKNYFARLHALWTLEGLGALTPELVREKLKDTHPQLRIAALRVGESLYKAGDQSLAADVTAAMKDADENVVIQSLLTAKRLDYPEWRTAVGAVASAHASRGVKLVGAVPPPPPPAGGLPLTPEQLALYKTGETNFKALCATCHGADATGLPMAGAAPGAMLAPSLAGTKTITGHQDGAIKIMLHGLVGDIDGKKYEGQMIAMATNDDAWIAGVLSYLRTNFGNRAGLVSPADVAALRAATKARTQPWTINELRDSLPQPLTNRKDWKLTASHGAESAAAAVDGNADSRFQSGVPQGPGVWLQIELPQPATVSGLVLDNAKPPTDFPRGYEVTLSNDGQTWSKPVASGRGAAPKTEIRFPATLAKFIRIALTSESNSKATWSICEVQVVAAGNAGQTASAQR